MQSIKERNKMSRGVMTRNSLFLGCGTFNQVLSQTSHTDPTVPVLIRLIAIQIDFDRFLLLGNTRFALLVAIGIGR